MKNKHVVYIDESNIASNTGHSTYVAIFVFSSDTNILSRELCFIENKINIKYLHWVDIPWKIRVKFSEKIKNLNFVCKYIIYRNPIQQDGMLESFIMRALKTSDEIDKIIIDGKRGNKYKQKLKKNLKNKGISFNKLIFADDKSEPLIRLADFLAGLIRSYFDNKNKHNEYMFNILKHKIKIPD